MFKWYGVCKNVFFLEEALRVCLGQKIIKYIPCSAQYSQFYYTFKQINVVDVIVPAFVYLEYKEILSCL